MNKLFSLHNGFMNGVNKVDFLAPLLLRVYLAPVLIQAGWNKIGSAESFNNQVSWFGNADWGLGLPMPEVMVALAGGTEFFGGIILLLGLGTRLIAIPMMITMLVAIFAVHWDNGWLAISDASSWLANDRVMEAVER
ncbi:MAG: DoxX family protein, partial [Porticoccaceae bacterium]|nr:DoxX family protein [Porticoccaceae bacterium]